MRNDGDPLVECWDLDGTLLRSDLLYESLLLLLRKNALYIFLIPFWLFLGKARMKQEIAMRVDLDVDVLPYESRLLEKFAGATPVYRVLCSASDESIVGRVSERLGLFQEVLASDGATNLGGAAKARALVERFGDRGFVYGGNARADIEVWRRSKGAWVVNASEALVRRAGRVTSVIAYLPAMGGGFSDWLKAVRLHQWLKNLLVFLPLMAAHRFMDPAALGRTGVVFVAFGLCASGVYVLNDLLDLQDDRRHPRKCKRPFAMGHLSIVHGMLAVPVLTLLGFVLAWLVSPAFAAVLLLYWGATLGYSLWFKRVEMLDVTVLAGLYTVRIIAGAVAIAVPLSFWLLAFSMFLFLGLAIIKRYTELRVMSTEGRDKASGRGYATLDLPLLQSLGAAAGYIAVLVLALYINSPESIELYSRPRLLWLLCPLLLYWTSRIWALAHRGRMHDDPVVFALTDRVSQIVMLLCGLVVLGAI